MIGPSRLPVGMRDFLPAHAAKRRLASQLLVRAFESWGYLPVVSPLFEHADVIERGLGTDARKALLRFVAPDGEVVSMRPDITPQIARIAATRYPANAHVRFFYEGLVVRSQDATGRLQQLQVGVEFIGESAPAGDAEVLALAAVALTTLGLREWIVEVGHVGLINHVLERLNDTDKSAVSQALTRKDPSVLQVIGDRVGGARGHLLAALPSLRGTPAQVWRRLGALSIPTGVARSLEALKESISRAKRLAGNFPITLDLAGVSGLDYYTGMRFRAHAAGVTEVVLQGGRYDDLVARFGERRPGAGFGISIDKVLRADMAANSPLVNSNVTAMVLCDPSALGRGLRLCEKLRRDFHGCAFSQAPERTHKKRAAQAQQHGYAFVVSVGDKMALYENGSFSPISAKQLDARAATQIATSS